MNTMSGYDALWNHSVMVIMFFTVSYYRNINVLLCSHGKC